MAGKMFEVKLLFNRLPQLAAEVKSQGDAHVEKTADAIVDGAQERAHVITGEMRDSIHRTGSGMQCGVSVGAKQGIFEEYGTSRRPAHPFFWPAVEAERSGYVSGWYPILNGTGQRAGSMTVTPGRGTTRRRTGGRLPRYGA